jgi:hypothetical protein
MTSGQERSVSIDHIRHCLLRVLAQIASVLNTQFVISDLPLLQYRGVQGWQRITETNKMMYCDEEIWFWA